MNLIILLISLASLLWSANHLITGAAGLANYYKLPLFITGFILVAPAVCIPEILLEFKTSSDGFNTLAFGNMAGLDIACIGLITGIISQLNAPLNHRRILFRSEFPILFLLMLLSCSLMLDGYSGVIDSSLSLMACLLFIIYQLHYTQKEPLKKQARDNFRKASLMKRSMTSYSFRLLAGLVVLTLSSRYLVSSGTWIMIAMARSFPLVIVSLMAVRKGEFDIAMGAVLGTNVFNFLTIMAFPGIINPVSINHSVHWHDIPVMLLTAAVLLWMYFRSVKRITRASGGLLILIYFCYLIPMFLSS